MEALLLENPRRHRRHRKARRGRKARKAHARGRRRNPSRITRRRRSVGGSGSARNAVMAALSQGGTIAGSFWLSAFVSNYLRNKFPTIGNYSASIVQAALGAGLVAARKYLPGSLARYAPALGAGMVGSALVDWLRNSDAFSPESVAGRLAFGFPSSGYGASSARRSGLGADTMLFDDGDNLLAPPELLGLGYDDQDMAGMTSFGGEA